MTFKVFSKCKSAFEKNSLSLDRIYLNNLNPIYLKESCYPIKTIRRITKVYNWNENFIEIGFNYLIGNNEYFHKISFNRKYIHAIIMINKESLNYHRTRSKTISIY